MSVGAYPSLWPLRHRQALYVGGSGSLDIATIAYTPWCLFSQLRLSHSRINFGSADQPGVYCTTVRYPPVFIN